MEPDEKRIYVYLIDDKEPIIINATGYHVHDGYYQIVDNYDKEIARFNSAFVKGIIKQ